MNILILTTHINTGGITSYLLTLTRGLVQKGHQVHLASSGGDREEAFQQAGVKTLKLDIRTKSELSPKVFAAVWKLRSFLKDNAIEVIHAQTRVTQVVGEVLSRLTGVTCMSTCHGFFKHARLARRIAPCWGRAVIAISPAVQEHLQRDFQVPAESIHLIANGIELEDFPLVSEPDRQKVKQRFALSSHRVIGMIARLSDVKGQHVLLDALPSVIKEAPDVRCVLVGQGKYEGKLRSQIVALGLQDHVRIEPIVSRTAEIFPLFDLFIVPSLQEGLGLSVLEAQAAGLPVVASEIGGIPTLIEDGTTGVMVPAGDAAALAGAITRLLQDPARSRDMGLRAREFVQSRFSAAVMVEKTTNVYEKVKSSYG